jgi:hypothetical protein
LRVGDRAELIGRGFQHGKKIIQPIIKLDIQLKNLAGGLTLGAFGIRGTPPRKIASGTSSRVDLAVSSLSCIRVRLKSDPAQK